MNRLSVIFLAGALAASSSFAEKVELTVRTPSVGDVRLECADAGGWKFETALGSDAGRDVVTVRIKSAAVATPPRFKVSFAADAPGSERVWTSNYRQYYMLWPSCWTSSWRNTSALAFETPIAAAMDYDEHATVTIACSEVFERVAYGLYVKETTGAIHGVFEFFTEYVSPRSEYEVKLLVDRRCAFWADSVREASDWIARTAKIVSPEPPASAFDPLYSTWYAYFQDVHADEIERESKLAASLGMKTMILDDGWQKRESKTFYSATGDWMPVATRFPDMKAHVARVHAAGLKYMLWISVPYVGDESEAWKRFQDKMLFKEGSKSPGNVGVLDPRFPEVREYLIGVCERIVRDWDFDGIKLDFIDQFSYKKGTDAALKDNYRGRDYKSVPEATDRLMKDILARLKAIKPDVMLEFRQHYMGAAILQYGHMIRAADCPADPVSNRKRICDLRLTSGKLAVHSDMIVWNRAETPAGAAMPILNALFSTIQYSMVLDRASEAHREVIRHWIGFTQKHRETLLFSEFRPHHPEGGFPLIEAESVSERIVAVYNRNTVVAGGAGKRQLVVNATAAENLVVEFASPAKVEAFDTFGKSVGVREYPAGLNRVAVPPSGYIQY